MRLVWVRIVWYADSHRSPSCGCYCTCERDGTEGGSLRQATGNHQNLQPGTPSNHHRLSLIEFLLATPIPRSLQTCLQRCIERETDVHVHCAAWHPTAESQA